VLLNGQLAYNIGDIDVRDPDANPAFAHLWTLTAEEANAATATAAEARVGEQQMEREEQCLRCAV